MNEWGHNMEICFFKQQDNICGALMGKYCNGYNDKCKFYKTEKKFIDDQNRAIELNIKKGNCENCKYRNLQCKVSQIPEKF